MTVFGDLHEGDEFIADSKSGKAALFRVVAGDGFPLSFWDVERDQEVGPCSEEPVAFPPDYEVRVLN